MSAARVHFGMAPATWARPEIGAFGLAILTILAMHVSPAGTCVVRQERIAQMLGVDRSRISREITRLADLGEVEKLARHDKDGWRVANAYRLPAVASLHSGCVPGARQEQNILEQDTLSGAQARDYMTSRKEKTAPPAGEQASGQEAPPSAPATVPAADWQPSAADLAYAEAHRPDVDTASVTRKFLVFHRSEGGRPVRDVSAVWRLWVERERVTRQRRPAAAGAGQGAAAPAAPRPAPAPLDPVTAIRRAGPGLVTTWRREAARRRPDLTAQQLASPDTLAAIVPDIIAAWRPVGVFAAVS